MPTKAPAVAPDTTLDSIPVEAPEAETNPGTTPEDGPKDDLKDDPEDGKEASPVATPDSPTKETKPSGDAPPPASAEPLPSDNSAVNSQIMSPIMFVAFFFAGVGGGMCLFA